MKNTKYNTDNSKKDNSINQIQEYANWKDKDIAKQIQKV